MAGDPSPHQQKLLVMPDDGVEAVVELIDQAQDQLLLKQFKLQSEAVEAALLRAHQRGVQVRVMLNPHTSGGDRWNDDAYALLTSMGIAIVAGLGTIGAIDYAISRRRATGQLKVTKDEARRDVKESEGDPFIRAARRARARQLAFSKMMAAVETADVVVANPTHIAVALRYDPTEMRAPRIVAKGRGFIAERIKKLAREKQVPVIEDRPLARAIVGRPIGAEVPPALYGAVAAILVLVARIRAGRTR